MDPLKNICPASSHQQHPRAKTNKQTTLQFFITAVQNILLFVLSLLFLLLPALSSGLQFKYRKKQLRTSPHTLSPGHSEFFKSPFHHTFSRIKVGFHPTLFSCSSKENCFMLSSFSVPSSKHFASGSEHKTAQVVQNVSKAQYRQYDNHTQPTLIFS